MFTITARALVSHGIPSALQVGGTQFVVTSVIGSLLCRHRIRRRRRISDGWVSNRRIALIVVIRIKNRDRQKHLTVRPRISKPAERTMDTRRMLRMYPKRQLSG